MSQPLNALRKINPPAARSRATDVPFLGIVVAALIFSGMTSPGRAQDVSAQFPEAAQVTTDYPDDVQRAVAFTVLYDTLRAISPKPMPRTAYDKDFSYQANSNAIATAKMANGGMQNGTYREYNDRYDQLLVDQNFRHSVREKYNLTPLVSQWRASQNLAPAQTPATTTPMPAIPQLPPVTPRPMAAPTPPAPAYGQPGYVLPPVPAPRTYEGFALIDALPIAFIPALFGLVPMSIATWFVSRRMGIGRKIRPVPAPQRGGLPALPRGLDVISLPGVRYATYVLSGMVLDIRTSTRHQTTTYTTGGEIIQGAGGQIMTTPLQTSTYSKSTTEEAIFVRTPDFHETVWTLTESPFQFRPGNIISILVRPLKEAGTGDILLAYNHSTSALAKCSGMEDAHQVRAVEIPQWTANLVAGMWVAPIFAIVSPPFYGGHGLNAEYCLGWFILTFVLVTLSFFITTPLVKNRIYKSRDGRFTKHYLPGLRQFFEQGTPVLQRAFQTR